MSIVIKVLYNSDEDIIIKDNQTSYKHVVEVLKYDDGSTTKYSLYIFSIKDAPIARELLMKCVENEEFDIDHIEIETRYNKIALDKIT
jgi:hypothetical protein